MKEFVIEIVADCLTRKFIRPLFLSSTKKDFPAYVNCLAEILDWSMEFYDLFYDTIITWEIFEQEDDNNYKAGGLDGLIIAFGYERIKKFYAQNTGPHFCPVEKYSTVEL